MSHNKHGRRVQRCTFPKERRPRTANEQTCTCKLNQCKCTRPHTVRARHNASSCKCLALLSPPRSQCILKQQHIKTNIAKHCLCCARQCTSGVISYRLALQTSSRSLADLSQPLPLTFLQQAAASLSRGC